ncbi:MAG TPA: anthranilate phosphoribosyltransferase, partial [Dehalococcoidia bacterium]|nr:anthranilate phosphoribosyltransferase [Dehalococcoidia bacterium]
EDNAATIRRVLQGEKGPIRDVVLLNSGAALVVGDRAATVRQGVEMAAEIVDSGQALRKLDELIELSQKLGHELG